MPLISTQLRILKKQVQLWDRVTVAVSKECFSRFTQNLAFAILNDWDDRCSLSFSPVRVGFL